MTPAVLSRALRLLENRMGQLEERIDRGDESAWPGYCEVIRTLAVVVDQTAPGAGALLTTAQLAARLQVSSKTVLRRKGKGLKPALVLGKRGRAAIRWRGDEVAR